MHNIKYASDAGIDHKKKKILGEQPSEILGRILNPLACKLISLCCSKTARVDSLQNTTETPKSGPCSFIIFNCL